MWADERLVGFDLETTSPDPEEARIVTGAVVRVGGGKAMVPNSWLADPGVEIPAEATEIHGVTTERAREHGAPAEYVIDTIIGLLGSCVDLGFPLVIVNARFDLTVLDREARRHGLEPLTDRLIDGARLRVIDPLVLDKWLHRYRKGSRRLIDTCAHYNVVLSDAHEAHSDALAGCRLAWRLGHSGRVIRRVRDRHDRVELATLTARWIEARDDLDKLHQLQVEAAAEQAARLQTYFREGNPKKDLAPDPDAYVEPAWPVIPFPAAALAA